MSERPFMQLYVSDFVGDTLQLSTEQIGAYMLLLMAMWNAGGRLPDDDAKLARVARLSLKRWRAVGADLLTFFERNEGEISHRRLARELGKAQGKSEARAAAGARGGAATALKTKAHVAANAGALARHLPETRHQNEKAPAFVSGQTQRVAQRGRNKPSGWQRPKTHTDAANAIIEEIRTNDRSRTAAGDEGAGGDVLVLSAIRPD
jgi:uncharacterized protein YdaU (DUF1376 family)